MPIKASYWDAWYEACKDDYFAWGEGGYWDLPKYTADSYKGCLLYTSPSPRDRSLSRMPSSA